MEHTVRVMRRHVLYRAFNAFTTNVRDVQDNKETVRQVLGRLGRLALAKAFDAFAGGVEEHRAHREQVVKVLCSWRAPSRAKRWAFDAWVLYVEEVQEERAEDARELTRQRLAEESERERTKAEKLVSKRLQAMEHTVRVMRRHVLYRAFNAFTTNVRDVQDNKETVRQVLGRLGHLALAKAFDAFAGGVEEHRAHRLLTCAAVSLGFSFGKRESYRRKGAVFMAWGERRLAKRRLRQTSRKVASRYDLLRARGALEEWAGILSERKKKEEEREAAAAASQAKHLILMLQRDVAVARIQHAPCG